MYRAKQLFEKQGFEIIPYKVDYKMVGNNEAVLKDLFPEATRLELTEKGFRELIGRFYYIFKY